ncbi:ASCH domain-containing protein [Nonomuraea sp. NPDC004580]|uniref:ASCH domain-containing protein n=1 Tax=Nonomuraea sp. NPDC004580 TaxID=3154552 RepID=UPI0033AC331D
MIALSVRQPWAYAITAGLKPIENRTWPTRHRGLLAIHASARWDGNDAAATVFKLSGQYVMKAPMSAIVGVVEVVGVHQSLTCVRPGRSRHTHPEGPFTCSPWAVGLGEFDGMWHWELANARQLAEPVECKGRLGLWPVAPEVEAAVLAQIGADA